MASGRADAWRDLDTLIQKRMLGNVAGEEDRDPLK